MRLVLRHVLLTAVSVLILYSAVLPQASNSISGFVFGPDRQPIADVDVELQDEFYRAISRKRTDGSGRFNFYRLVPARYYIHVITSSTGYEEQTKEVEIVNISRQSTGVTLSASTNVQQDFNLRQKDSGRATKIVKDRVVFAQDVPDDAKKAYEAAVAAFNKKKGSPEGVAELERAVKLFPNYFLALEKLAEEYIRLQRYLDAYETAVRAVETNPAAYPSWYTAGYASYSLKNYPVAITALDQALVLVPNSANALFIRGISLRLAGRYKDAEQSLLNAEKHSNDSVPEIHWQLALLYTNDLKDYNKAVDELNAFLRAKPNYDEADKVRDLIRKLKAKSGG